MVFFCLSEYAAPCVPQLAALGAKAWYGHYGVEDYTLSFSGSPLTNPVRLITHSYHSAKFVTRRTEVRGLGGPNVEVLKAMDEKGLTVDQNGWTVFKGLTREQSIEDPIRLGELEQEIMLRLSDEGWARYHREIDERLKYAFEEYPKDWPPEFLEFLTKSAHDWDNAMHSKYIEVFSRTSSGEAGDRVGVFFDITHSSYHYEVPAVGPNDPRLARQTVFHEENPDPKSTAPGVDWIYTAGFPPRRLTVEDFFQEKFPMPRVILADDAYVIHHRNTGMRKIGGLKSEPRNWRIKQGVSPEVFGEILLQYVLALHSSLESTEFKEDGNFIYTYGPRLSVIRYVGIDPITMRESKREGLGFELMSPDPIVRYDIHWWKLAESPQLPVR